MQGIYYRRNAHVPWQLVRETRSVADAEEVARRTAKEKRSGRLLYVETPDLPSSAWDMRTVPHRLFAKWSAKELLPNYERISVGGRARWVVSNPKQINLFEKRI